MGGELIPEKIKLNVGIMCVVFGALAISPWLLLMLIGVLIIAEYIFYKLKEDL